MAKIGPMVGSACIATLGSPHNRHCRTANSPANLWRSAKKSAIQLDRTSSRLSAIGTSVLSRPYYSKPDRITLLCFADFFSGFLDVFCGVAGVDYQFGVFDDEVVVVSGVIGGD